MIQNYDKTNPEPAARNEDTYEGLSLKRDSSLKIEVASATPPPGLAALLADLGDGQNGFMGTSVHTGEITVEQYLLRCREEVDPEKLRPGRVPQTVYWLLDDEGTAVGMIRVRHYLTERLLSSGGHIGFFIHSGSRGKGYAKEALRLALAELRRLGENRALLTVHSDNTSSIAVIEANEGRLENTVTDPETGKELRRYWIDLKS